MWYLYIIECEDSSLYTGVTENLERRFREHQARKGSEYTKLNPPTKIIYSEFFPTEMLAKTRENQIKGWSRAKKWALVKGDSTLLRKLSLSRD